MVNFNTGAQDPDKADQLSCSDTNGTMLAPELSDDELDEETVGSPNYQLLPTDDFTESATHPARESHQIIADGLPSIIPIEEVLVKELWSGSTPKEVDIEMDSTKIVEVKEAMVNVTLPSEVFPEWAINIPEDSWKQLILNRIKK